MRICGWHVDGFGVLRDAAVPAISPGLTVFVGPNEAGKSTLVNFIVTMLFGFPDGRSRERRYPPLNGGTHGGRLQLANGDGAFLIARYAGQQRGVRLTLPNGKQGTDDDLRVLLGGCDRKLFRSIFAIGLTELQSFETLDETGVRDRIFSAGIVGAGRDARDAIGELRERQIALLRPRGQARISGLVTRILSIESDITAAQRLAQRYTEIRRTEESKMSEAGHVADAIDQARTKNLQRDLLISIWPAWCERLDAGRQLVQLEAVDVFPPDPEERLARVLEGLATATEDVAAATAELEATKRRRGDISLDESVVAVESEIADVYKELELQRERLARLPEVEERHSRVVQQLDERLRDLGPTWDRRRLAAFDTSIPRSEDIRSYESRIAEAHALVNRVTERVERAEGERRTAEKDRDKLLAEFAALPEPPTAEEVGEFERAVRRLRAHLAELATVILYASGAETEIEGLVGLEQEATASAPQVPPRQLGLMFLAAAIVLLALATWWMSQSDPAPALAVAAGGLSIVLVLSGLRSYRRASTIRDSRERVMGRFASQRQRAEQLLAAHRQKLVILEEAISVDARLLGLVSLPTNLEVEDAAGDIALRRASSEIYERKQNQLSAAAEYLHEKSAMEKDARQILREAVARLTYEHQIWTAWKQNAGVPDLHSPQGVLDFFEAVRVARDALRDVGTVEAELAQVNRAIEGFVERVQTILVGIGEDPVALGPPVLTVVEGLHWSVTEAREASRRCEELDDEVEKLSLKVDAKRRVLSAYEKQRDALFAEAGVEDEQAFRRSYETFKQRKDLREIVKQCERRLTEHIGNGTAADDIRNELATGDIQQWQDDIIEAEHLIAALQERRDEALKAWRDAERERQQIEDSADVIALEQDRASLLAEIEEAVHEWRVLALAEGMIEGTLNRFERERQPEVLDHASRLFAQVTEGEYVRLLQRESVIAILDRRGRTLMAENLSRGTAEQLYLCLRLGLVAEFARREHPMPLIMDDVLVNFDPVRSRATAAALCEFAQSHQVLLFTCHPETAALIRELDPTCGYHLMARYGNSTEAKEI